MRRRSRSYRVFWPLTAVAVGAGILVAQTGWLSGNALWRLGATWPLFFVFGGLAIILRSYLTPRSAAIVLTLCFAVGTSSAIAYAAVGPDLGGASVTVTSSQPRQSVTAASLVINGPVMSVDVRAGATGGALYTATVVGGSADPPRVTFNQANATVTVDTDTQGRWPFGFGRPVTVVVNINEMVAWNVSVNGGSVDGTLDLRSAATEVQVNTASANLTMILGTPVTAVPVELNGAAINADITVPATTACAVAFNGAVASITVDGHQTNSIGNGSWTDPGYSFGGAGYRITANGASSTVSLGHTGS